MNLHQRIRRVQLTRGTHFWGRTRTRYPLHPVGLLDDETQIGEAGRADENHRSSDAVTSRDGRDGDGPVGDADGSVEPQVPGQYQGRNADRLPVLNRHRVCRGQTAGLTETKLRDLADFESSSEFSDVEKL